MSNTVCTSTTKYSYAYIRTVQITTNLLLQKTATKAVIEMCEGDEGLGDGFQLLIGLAEIHVPRMWVEENDQSHHVRHYGII